MLSLGSGTDTGLVAPLAHCHPDMYINCMKSVEIAARWTIMVGGFVFAAGWFVSSLLVRTV